MKIISVFIGGGFGAILRYLASCLAGKYFMTPVPGTFFVNIAGCFIIGYIFAFSLHKIESMPQMIKLFITVGFLGGLTTFSTLNLEIFEFIKAGKIFYGLAYLLLSCVSGLLFTYIGYYLYSKFC